jgi:hypothetical protein
MRRSRIFVFAAVAFGFAAAAGACGLDEGGILVDVARDGSITADGATVDGQIVDGQTIDSPAATDGAPIDADAGPDGATVIEAGKPYFCGTTPVANCATDCPLFPILCGAVNLCVNGCGLCGSGTFECDGCFGDGGLSVSVCEPEDAGAFSSCLSGQTRCPCNDQGNCPGSNQTCNGNMCFECGEVDAGNNNDVCKSGGGGHMCKQDPGNFGKCN